MSRLALFLLPIIFSFTAIAQPQKIYVDPKSAINTSISQLFKSVEFIPLETNNHSLFSRASALVVTDKYYIVLDESIASVLFFDKTGKFLSLFKSRNEDILDMQYVTAENTVFIRTQKRGLALNQQQKFTAIKDHKNDYYKLWTCNLNIPGNFDFKPLKDFAFAGYTIYPLSPTRFLASAIFARKNMENREAYELDYITNNRITRHFFPYNQQEASSYYNQINKVSFFKSNSASAPLFVRPFRYDFYAFKNDRIDTTYRLIFPATQSLPPDFFSRNLSDETAWEVLRKQHQGAVQNIIPVLSWKNHLAFWLTTLQPNNMRDFRQYILDLNNQTLINARTLAADSISFHIPVNFTWLMASDDTSIYTFLFPSELEEYSPEKIKELPLSLRTFLEQKTNNANPIIVRLINK